MYTEDYTDVSHRNFDVRPKESCDLIGQYTRVNAYWPIKSHDTLGLWLQSSTGHVGIIFDITNQIQPAVFVKKTCDWSWFVFESRIIKCKNPKSF